MQIDVQACMCLVLAVILFVLVHGIADSVLSARIKEFLRHQHQKTLLGCHAIRISRARLF